MSIRPVKKLMTAKPTVEGAGVHLCRAFGFGQTAEYDPFLLLDDFRNDVPEDYLPGFPWHPHRGIEMITYVLAGTVEHGDSLGNHGAIGAGDIQWMTAGAGIIHREMPKGDLAHEREQAREQVVDVPRDAADDSVADEGQSEDRTEAELGAGVPRQVRDALQRTEDGTYGHCLVDGTPTEPDRLDAVPWAAYYNRHQEQVEATSRPTPTL